MNFSIETVRRLYASGRNYASLFLGVAAGVGIVSVAQQKELTDSLNEVYQGVTMIVHGATSIWQVLIVIGGPVVAGVLARFASNSAKTSSQVANVAAVMSAPSDPQALETKAAVLSIAADLPEVPEPIKVTNATLAAMAPSGAVIPASPPPTPLKR